MKVFTIAGKTLKETMRQHRSLALTLGLPVAFMVIFGLAFGESDRTTFDLAVVDHDGTDLSAAFLDGIRTMEYSDGTPLFDVVVLRDEAAARVELADAAHDALVVVPQGFERDALPSPPPNAGSPLAMTQPQEPVPPAGATVAVVGDPSRVPFATASQILAAYAAAFAEGITGEKPAVTAATEAVTAAELTAFDFIAPGLMVFAILNMVPGAAATLARESESRALDRVRMSPTGAASLLGGVALAQLAVASVSLALMLATARLMGFQNQGSYLAAYLIAIVAALAVTGVAMLVAALVKTQQEASGLGTLIAVPASFLSGAFFAIPGVSVFGLFELYDVLPTTHATSALRQVMTYGRDVEVASGALVALGVLAVVYFLAGVGLYRRTRLAPQ